MKRIAVVGCPGTGKTTFSRRLGQKTSLPVVHLDYYYHQKKYNYYHDKEAWVKRVEQLINQDKWIIDGNYKSTFELRFKRADTIIFLDYPRRVAMYGAIKRRVEHRNKLREEMPSDWKEKANLEFLRYVWNFKKKHRGKILEALDKAKAQDILTFTNRQQAEEYLNALGNKA